MEEEFRILPKIGDTLYWMYYIDRNQNRVIKCTINEVMPIYYEEGDADIDIYASYMYLKDETCNKVFAKKFSFADINRICYKSWEDCKGNDYRCVLDEAPFEWRK